MTKYYYYHRKRVRILTFDEKVMDSVTPDNVDLSDPRLFFIRNTFIGNNIIQFAYYDLDKFISWIEEADIKDGIDFTLIRDKTPYFLFGFVLDLYDIEKYTLKEDELLKFKNLQKEYRNKIESFFKFKVIDSYVEMGEDEKDKLRNYLNYSPNHSWIKFESLEEALRVEWKFVILSGVKLFKCLECGKIATGTENVRYCSCISKIVERYKLHPDFGEYCDPKLYTCQQVNRDKISNENLKQLGKEMELEAKRKRNNLSQKVKRNDNIKWHPLYKDLIIKLKELGNEYQEMYDESIDNNEKQELVNDYKKAFDILIMQPQDNDEYITWEEWEKIYLYL